MRPPYAVTLSYNDFRRVVPSAQSVDHRGAIEPGVLAADQAVRELHDRLNAGADGAPRLI
jgi:hypothetical protein